MRGAASSSPWDDSPGKHPMPRTWSSPSGAAPSAAALPGHQLLSFPFVPVEKHSQSARASRLAELEAEGVAHIGPWPRTSSPVPFAGSPTTIAVSPVHVASAPPPPPPPPPPPHQQQKPQQQPPEESAQRKLELLGSALSVWSEAAHPGGPASPSRERDLNRNALMHALSAPLNTGRSGITEFFFPFPVSLGRSVCHRADPLFSPENCKCSLRCPEVSCQPPFGGQEGVRADDPDFAIHEQPGQSTGQLRGSHGARGVG